MYEITTCKAWDLGINLEFAEFLFKADKLRWVDVLSWKLTSSVCLPTAALLEASSSSSQNQSKPWVKPPFNSARLDIKSPGDFSGHGSPRPAFSTVRGDRAPRWSGHHVFSCCQWGAICGGADSDGSVPPFRLGEPAWHRRKTGKNLPFGFQG